MNDKTDDKPKHPWNIWILLSGLVMTFIGTTLALWAKDLAPGSTEVFCRSVGLAFIVTGITSVFHEALLWPFRRKETKADSAKLLDEMHRRFDEIRSNFKGPDVRMIAQKREGYGAYHRWVLEKVPQEVFFAGHSVLHRIQRDLSDRALCGSVEEALARRVAEGCNIKILFLDPTWEMLPVIAESENQKIKTVATHIATSLGICKRLWMALVPHPHRGNGSIEISTCRELHQYAFHHVIGGADSVQMFMGFYFAKTPGLLTPLFVVESEDVQKWFAMHFDSIFRRQSPETTWLLSYQSSARAEFNDEHYRKCRESLGRYLNDDPMLNQLCP